MTAPALCCPASLLLIAWSGSWFSLVDVLPAFPRACLDVWLIGYPATPIWDISTASYSIEDGYTCITRHPSPGYFLRHANEISAQLVDPLLLFSLALTN